LEYFVIKGLNEYFVNQQELEKAQREFDIAQREAEQAQRELDNDILETTN
jgi:uncharacterized membrane protein (DUF106 family)